MYSIKYFSEHFVNVPFYSLKRSDAILKKAMISRRTPKTYTQPKISSFYIRSLMNHVAITSYKVNFNIRKQKTVGDTFIFLVLSQPDRWRADPFKTLSQSVFSKSLRPRPW